MYKRYIRANYNKGQTEDVLTREGGDAIVKGLGSAKKRCRATECAQ